MSAINSVTDYTLEGDVGVITLNSPPVNALSVGVREGVHDAMAVAVADPGAKAIVLICEGRTFIAGADIGSLGGPKRAGPPIDPQGSLENSPKPVIAAIHGTALGGGLEYALSCHYRVAVPSARCGLPEVHLGLLAGSGGTQRLPRVVGPLKALELVTGGEQISAPKCFEMGLLDALVEEGKLREGAIAFANQVIAEKRPLKKISELNDKVEAARGHPEIFDDFRKANAAKFRGLLAPEYNIRCIEAAVNQPFEEGIRTEWELFNLLLNDPQSAALRYTFFAERQIAKIPGLSPDTPQIPIKCVGVIGAGAMGGGIAMNFANVGIPVTIVDVAQASLDRGLKVIRANYERTAARGGITQAQVEERTGLLKGSTELGDLAQVDLIIEAVFERMDVKKEVFRKLDAIAKPGAILASNTSFLDINEIGAETKRPEFVIGMHFFSPANVMKLLEVVRTRATSDSVIATVMALGKKIGKIAGLVGVSHGFVANRLMALRSIEAERLILEGPMPWDVDRVLYDFGFPMGPFAMGDVVGLDVTWDKANSHGQTVRDVLCEHGRFGQKTGSGYYDYDENRKGAPSEFTVQVIKDLVAKFKIAPRQFSDEEILERCLYPVINEGAKVLEEGVALRASDIDIIIQNGYGWPAYRGGPMWWGDQLGLDKVLAKMIELHATFGEAFRPAPLLEKLAAEGKRFQDFKA